MGKVVDLVARCTVVMVYIAFSHTVETEACNCWEQVVPSCGANGRTYNNYCVAQCANVTVAYDGKCKPNSTSTVKACEQCADDYDPVCGTDGITYSTKCFAKCSGATMAFTGPCFGASAKCLGACSAKGSPVCDTVKGITYSSKCVSSCAGVNLTQAGQCMASTVNTSAQSCFCNVDNMHPPVCGNDRRSYSDRCFARCAGVEVVYEGECQNVPEPSTARNNWMRWATYKVCGVDGKPYPNLCHAKCAGIGVASMIGGVC